MNKVELTGRPTRDPDIRRSQTQSGEEMTIARYTLAVDRKVKKEEGQTADFIPCVAFGKNGEFVEKYLRQGMKIGIVGRIQTGSYTDRDGKKVYTVEVVVEEHEFEESKKSAGGSTAEASYPDNVSQTEQVNNQSADQKYESDNQGDKNTDLNEEGFMDIPQKAYDDIPYRI
ncbi:MAG: single-stranded DNA-binding protein [Eubacterium sp.]|nr:single-stranded DNA-binding protein [Eubacterium sp.]